ncbi:hypothetical protein [Rhodococcus baikonurensis]|uniref:DUF222 domain-containing protein n=1 Tax=Rhodococcus baikonurensis TaxID=172041 RepID=A0ABV5XS55_9NOCA
MTKNADLKASIRLLQSKNPGMSYRAAREAVLAAKTVTPQGAALSRDELLLQQYCASETDADMQAFIDTSFPAAESDETAVGIGRAGRKVDYLGMVARNEMREDKRRTLADLRLLDESTRSLFGFGKSFISAARIADLHAPGSDEE